LTLIYPIGMTAACTHACTILKSYGFSLVDHPTPEATHLLLDVPSFRPGAEEMLLRLLPMLPPTVTIIGGNLDHPILEEYQTLDLLKNEVYLCKNAAITADCALRIAAPLLHTTFADSPTLIIGWGRIAKCLAAMLKALGASVTIAARKEKDRAMAAALGYGAQDTANLDLKSFSLLYNTAPEPIAEETQLTPFPKLVKIDLASRPGLSGKDIHIARGLPGIHTPISSGRLIAETILKEVKP